MAGIYADEGISGTNTKKREQFNKMIEDCKVEKIDMIITKSISRFARNTLDCLNYVRMLKEIGIGVIFEKENINTFNAKIENKDFFREKWKGNLKSENALVKYKSIQSIAILKDAEPIQDLDIDLFYSIIEKMTVFEGEKIIVSLLDGTEIECELE